MTGFDQIKHGIGSFYIIIRTLCYHFLLDIPEAKEEISFIANSCCTKSQQYFYSLNYFISLSVIADHCHCQFHYSTLRDSGIVKMGLC